MSTGTARLDGELVSFIDCIVFNGKIEFLIALNSPGSVCEWMRAEQLTNITYHVNTQRIRGVI
jgi:hypothetical protein